MDETIRFLENDALTHMLALSTAVGGREMGSPEEARAAEYIAACLSIYEIETHIQPFNGYSFLQKRPIQSQNVIGTMPGTEPDSEIVMISAHHDSVMDGTGAIDNACGVGCILAVTRWAALRGKRFPFELRMISFGAEEGAEPSGASFYVSSLSPAERERILVQINLDTIGAGDNLNVYAGAKVTRGGSYTDKTPGPTWARDMAARLAVSLGYQPATSPASTWNGFSGPWGDHYPFVLLGVPIAFIEFWNWEYGDDPGWGQETEQGDFMHTADDRWENVRRSNVRTAAHLLNSMLDRLASGERG